MPRARYVPADIPPLHSFFDLYLPYIVHSFEAKSEFLPPVSFVQVTNIPNNMVADQFGMAGLLTFIRVAESDSNLVSLALGSDLTTLGLNLNSPEPLYNNFGGPWAENPCRPQDIDFHVPPEYLTNAVIRDKLALVKLNRYQEDLLFYLFYTNVGDAMQLAASLELYNRDWRYHKVNQSLLLSAAAIKFQSASATPTTIL